MNITNIFSFASRSVKKTLKSSIYIYEILAKMHFQTKFGEAGMSLLFVYSVYMPCLNNVA